MFLFVIGLPGRYGEWCASAVARLAERALGPIEWLHADTLEQLSLGVMRTGAARAVVAAYEPGGALRRTLVEAGRNFVVALEEPAAVLAEMGVSGTGLAAATRAVASSCGALHGVRDAPGALILRRDRNPPGPATAAAIAHHFGLAVDLVGLAELGAESVAPLDPVEWWRGLDDPARAMIAGALQPYATPGKSAALVWTAGLFSLGDRPNEPIAGPVDITGRARRLIDGPRIMLPPGAWTLSLSAEFSRETAEHEFLVEIATERPLASGAIRPQHEGATELRLDFTVDDASEQPVAIRISSQRAAFDGAIAGLRAALTPPPGTALQIVVDVEG